MGYTLARSEPRRIFYCLLWCLGSYWYGNNGCLRANSVEPFQKGLGSLAPHPERLAERSRTMSHFLGQSAAFMFSYNAPGLNRSGFRIFLVKQVLLLALFTGREVEMFVGESGSHAASGGSVQITLLH
jgi:hypothetical protein